jgi:hypothetical protein
MTRGWTGYGPVDANPSRRERLRRYLTLSWFDLRTWVSIRAEQAWGWLRWNLKGRRGV